MKAGGAVVAGSTLWIARYFLVNHKRPVYPPPDSLITLPSVEGTVTRHPEGLELKWERPSQVTRIHASLQPDLPQFDPLQTPALASVEGSQRLLITGLDSTQRWYFFVYFDSDPVPLILAERILPLESGFNVRDLGGYQTRSGKRVRWGRVYRGSHLSSMSEADLAQLNQLGLHLICDLRTLPEIEEAPNMIPDGVTMQRVPILPDHESTASPRAILMNLRQLDKLMIRTYIQLMLTRRAEAFGQMLRLIADPAHHPILFHCTAGKDRTGLTAALVLSALDVPEETILADYSLTNLSYERIYQMINHNAGRLKALRLSVDDLQPLLTADSRYLKMALAYLRERYGSIEAYLTSAAGLTPAVLESLRKTLLW